MSDISGDAAPVRGTRHSVPEHIGKAYWRENLTLMGILLAIWFTVSFGFGILLRDWLDRISIGGAPLGFWFAQQGAIYVFVVLIFVYAFRMNAVERRLKMRAMDE